MKLHPDLKSFGLTLAAVLVGLAVHQAFIAPVIAKKLVKKV